MNVHFSYKASKNAQTEQEVQRQTDKLAKRLQVFRPELVHLHGVVAESSQSGGGISVSLNLRLPSGQMAAQNTAATSIGAIKSGFHDLIHQLNAHKDLLRNRHKWHRLSREYRGVPFEQTVAAVNPNGTPLQGGTLTSRDIDQYVATELPRLNRFIDRELRYREATGMLEPNLVKREEVVDESIATALSGEEHRPERVPVERWLYGLALRAISVVAARNRDDLGTVHLEVPAGRQNVSGTDDAYLQFHQPDDKLNTEDILPNLGISTPEAVALSDEFIDQVERALTGAPAKQREAFTLFAIEGFTIDEIADISKSDPSEIKKSIKAARELVDRKLPNGNVLKKHLLNNSRVA
ncbi:MAG TPA: sigma factor-like helix-turn-helix DNA-binding protein [Terriglobales bacterium]|nr:sigma factor-like helix-turn-helix DNA-binding protein [Terriglobales bacterium]